MKDSANLDWSFFRGRAFCMTLRSTPERRESARQEFARVGLEDIVQFVEFDRDPAGSRVGTWHGHVRILRDAYEAGLDHVLVFEDDVTFDLRHLNQQVLNRSIDYITNRRYEIFYLGHIPWRAARTADSDILRVRSVMLHAHVVSRRWMQWLFANMPARIDPNVTVIDDYYAIHGADCYAIHPMFCYQLDDEVAPSSHNWGPTGEIRRWCYRQPEVWGNLWASFLSASRPVLPIHKTKYEAAAFALTTRLVTRTTAVLSRRGSLVLDALRSSPKDALQNKHRAAQASTGVEQP